MSDALRPASRRRKSSDDEHPRLVAIETTNRCNAACSFCPNSRLVRDRQTMSDDLFRKIIDDCRSVQPRVIEPFLNGEPLMDPKIMPRMEHIRRMLPHTKLRLYTNASLLTPARIDELTDLRIDHLFISLNSVDSETYRRTTGLPLERTLANLAYLTDSKRRSRVAGAITFRMTRTQDQTLFMQDQFIDYCRKSGVRPFIVGLFNYKGDIDSLLPVPGYPCEHLSRLDILASGRSTLCCMDHEGRHTWGDLNLNSVLEVFNSPSALQARRMHRSGRRKEYAPCNACNLFWPGFSGTDLPRRVRFLAEAATYFLLHQPNGRKDPTSIPSSNDPGQTMGAFGRPLRPVVGNVRSGKD